MKLLLRRAAPPLLPLTYLQRPDMAAVHGPSLTQHPTLFHAHMPLLRMHQPTARPDPYYRHENIAWLCGHFISHLFACPEYLPTSSGSSTKLPYFIVYTLHQTKLVGYIRCPCPATAPEGSISHCSRVIRPPTLYFSLHGHFKGDLQRHLLQQIMEHRWSGYVSVAGD